MILAEPLQEVVLRKNLQHPTIWQDKRVTLLKYLDPESNTFLPAIRIFQGKFVEL